MSTSRAYPAMPVKRVHRSIQSPDGEDGFPSAFKTTPASTNSTTAASFGLLDSGATSDRFLLTHIAHGNPGPDNWSMVRNLDPINCDCKDSEDPACRLSWS